MINVALRRGSVSIRAPARGATPTASVEAFVVALFQSAPPHGERPSCSGLYGYDYAGFNPRPRTGSD